MASPSTTHLVLIPSYNTGPRVLRTVREARAAWDPVWVVVDGSTDGTGETLADLAREDPGLTVIRQPRNAGKGAAVLAGVLQAGASAFTHALTMDADGQHPAECIAAFMAQSQRQPEAMVLGAPVFDDTAPALRVQGRKISNRLARLEALGAAIDDVLCGFRVYPIGPLVSAMAQSGWMRRFDFDPEVVVRLSWMGVPAINCPAPVRYLTAAEGGVSHFHYGRDNLLLTWMHLRLLMGAGLRLAAGR